MLGPLDHFHTGVLQSSRELMELAQIRADERVLDIGAGLGGCARLLAAETGCRVECLELSADYCTGARLLNRLTGLDDRIGVHLGSALELPFENESFDVVWMQNVGMNIADKPGLYDAIARALKPGGLYVFQEVTAGPEPTAYFPLPWATEPADSHLASADEIGRLLAERGLHADRLEDVSDADFSTSVANHTPAAAGNLGLAVYVDRLAEKADNAGRSLADDQIRFYRGVFRRG